MSSLSTNLNWDLAKNRWPSQLNPLLQNPICNGNILPDIKLSPGVNVINHLLGYNLSGYLIIQKSANASIYDNQINNQTPRTTLVLVSDINVTISLYVF